VRVGDGCGHVDIGFVGRVTEHEPLISCALLMFAGFVHAHGDVAGLHAKHIHYFALDRVDTQLQVRIADVSNDLPGERVDVDVGVSSNLACQHDQVVFQQRLASDPRVDVLLEHGVEHRIGNLIGHLVGMSFADGFGREDLVFAHLCVSSADSALAAWPLSADLRWPGSWVKRRAL